MKRSQKILINSLVACSFTFVGYIFGAAVERSKKSEIGVLRIDKSEEDAPEKIFLELNTDVESLKNKKCVQLKVLSKNYVARK